MGNVSSGKKLSGNRLSEKTISECNYPGNDCKPYQSTEGESCKGKQPREHKENTEYTYAYTHTR